jgi:hypothetical protein
MTTLAEYKYAVLSSSGVGLVSIARPDAFGYTVTAVAYLAETTEQGGVTDLIRKWDFGAFEQRAAWALGRRLALICDAYNSTALSEAMRLDA